MQSSDRLLQRYSGGMQFLYKGWLSAVLTVPVLFVIAPYIDLLGYHLSVHPSIYHWRSVLHTICNDVAPTAEVSSFNLLKPTGYVMHHQFNIQQLYALPTVCLCVLYLSENKQRLVPLTA